MPAIDEHLLDTLSGQEEGVVCAIAREPFGRFVLPSTEDAIKSCILVCKFFGSVNIFVAVPSRSQADHVRGALEDTLDERVDIVTKTGPAGQSRGGAGGGAPIICASGEGVGAILVLPEEGESEAKGGLIAPCAVLTRSLASLAWLKTVATSRFDQPTSTLLFAILPIV